MFCASHNLTFSQSNQIQRVRISFTSPDNAIRQLLLGFTPNDAATDDFDWGYDARNPDNFPNDLNWMINDERYVIQGVGSFSDTKSYPLGMFLSNEGNISIGLHSLENFDFDVQVYLYDALVDEHTLLNQGDFTGNFSPGTYTDRFYITFSANSYPQALSVVEVDSQNLNFEYHRNNKSIQMSDHSTVVYISEVSLFDMSGKKIFSQKIQDSATFNLEGINLPDAPLLCQINTNVGSKSKIIVP
jgi:hypothetical protein